MHAERLAEADEAVAGGEVAVLSLDPFGKPVEGLPVGVTDYATAVRVHGDQRGRRAASGPALEGRSATTCWRRRGDSAAAQGLRLPTG